MPSGRIAIVGGGPGGLVLARILQTREVAATVFERESSVSDRSQGRSLDLHPETGQHAVRLAGLEAEFRRVCRPEDQGARLYDPAGTLRFAGQGANLALRDGADLARARADADPADWSAAVWDYETTMFARAATEAAGSAQGLEDTFADDALDRMMVHFQEHAEHP